MKSENIFNKNFNKYYGVPIIRVNNIDYLNSLRGIYKCNICFKIMINPSDCDKCGHSYCFDCISDSNCPFNCLNYNIRSSSIGIKLILNNLNFKCENDGCIEIIPYNSFINHDIQCEFKLFKCPNMNCGINLNKNIMQNHIDKECKFTNEKCKFCGYDFPRLEIKNHTESCEAIFQSLNLSGNEDLHFVINSSHDSFINNSQIINSSNVIARKDYSNIKAKSYLEALSLNLSKIVKENDEKYKDLQEKNKKIKYNYQNDVKDLLAKIQEKLEKIKAHNPNIFNKFFNEFNEGNHNEIEIENIKYKIEKADINHNEDFREIVEGIEYKNNEIISLNENLKDKIKNNNLDDDFLKNDYYTEAFFKMENIFSGDKSNIIEQIKLIEFIHKPETIYDNKSNLNKKFKEKKKEFNNEKNYIQNFNQMKNIPSHRSYITKNVNENLLKKFENNQNSKKFNLFKHYLKCLFDKQLNDEILKYLTLNIKFYIDDYEEKLKKVFNNYNIKKNKKFSEDFILIIKQIVKLSEENIKSFLKDIKIYIIEEFKVYIKKNDTKYLLISMEIRENNILENLTKFNFEILDIKNQMKLITDERKETHKISKTENKKNIFTNDETLDFKFNSYNMQEIIIILMNKTENIKKIIKKIYDENIKDFIKTNDDFKNIDSNFLQNYDIFKLEIKESINENVELKNVSILKYLEESKEELKILIEKNFKKFFEILNKNEKIFEIEFLQEKILESSDSKVEDGNLIINIEKLTFNLLSNIGEIIVFKIEEINSFFQEKIEKQTKEINLNILNEDIKNKNIEYKNNNDIYLDEKFYASSKLDLNNNNLDYQKIKLDDIMIKFEKNINNEFELIKNYLKVFEINNKDIKSFIREEFNEINGVLEFIKTSKKFKIRKNNFENNYVYDPIYNEKLDKEIIDVDSIEELPDKKFNSIYEQFLKSNSQYVNEEFEKLKIIIKHEIIIINNDKKDKLFKNSTEIKNLQEDLENKGFCLKKLDIIVNKIDFIQEELKDNINTALQNINKVLDFNQMDFLLKLKENIEIIRSESDINKKSDINFQISNKIDMYHCENQINNNKIEKKENSLDENDSNLKFIKDDFISKNNSILKGEIINSFDKIFKAELERLDEKIEHKINEKFREFYELQWCYQCEKIDYKFAFTLCQICNKENCKSCIKLCKTCKSLICKKCILCPKCSDISCINCRKECFFCSTEKSIKFCLDCLKNCYFCKKSICINCTKKCLNCSSLTCKECARICQICFKCSCRRCETIKNFKNCFNCEQTACNECLAQCLQCKLEFCNNCFNSCRNCNKLLCKKCFINCENCGDIFCDKCAKKENQHNCNLCNKIFCNSCLKYLLKCKKCSIYCCKNCCSYCFKCKNVFCKNCTLNCDSCEDYSCFLCVYKCACEKLIFCEKCLFGVTPISPDMHSCNLFLNGSPLFSGIKSRSKVALPKNFEAKFCLERFESCMNFLIGLTDNSTFNEDTLSFIDNIWVFKPKTGQKYSTMKSLENYYNKEAREKDSIIVAKKNDNLYFRVNFDDNPPAFHLPSFSEYFIYIENDSIMSNLKIKFIYLREI